MHLIFPLCNVALGLIYAFSDGPYVMLEGGVTSARELVSSGSDDWSAIVVALSSFIVSLSAAMYAVDKPVRPTTVKAIYAANYFVFTLFLYLANLDVSLVDSVRYGDWPLALAVSIPTIGLIVILARAR